MTARAGTALVTGGSRGLGLAIARKLVRDGVRVGVVARSADGVRNAVTELSREEGGGRVAGQAADITRPDALHTALDQLQAELGEIDLLINNAGIEGPFGPLWECDVQEWWQAMDIHVRGALLTTHALLPAMLRRRNGCVVNIVSHAGAHRWPHVSAYSVSKAAVIKLTENLGAELRGSGVYTAALHPGIVLTGFTDAALAGHHDPSVWRRRVHEWTRRQIAAGHGVAPETAAEAVTHLADHLTDITSGGYFTVDDVKTAVAPLPPSSPSPS
ncbi:SDR family oxidoreductase [Streptomyces sp. NPDC004610]|uniref:SDR family oxidoreductase n=1 Tax=unclassified Streptomyces TaxID=2593676 RepID=UPI0033A249F4